MAARIESLTKSYGSGILICDATRRSLDAGVPLRELDRIRVRGQQAPTTLYEVLTGDAVAPDAAGWLEAFEAGRAAYAAGRFEEALNAFRTVGEMMSERKGELRNKERQQRIIEQHIKKLEAVLPDKKPAGYKAWWEFWS